MGKRWYKLVECGERNIKVTIFGKNKVLSVKLAKMVAWVKIERKVLSFTTQIGYVLDFCQKEWLHFEKMEYMQN